MAPDYDISVLRDEDGSPRALAFSRQPDAPGAVATALPVPFGGPGERCLARLEKFIPGNGTPRCLELVPANRKSGCCNLHKMRIWEELHPRVAIQPSLFDPPPGPQFHLGPTHDVKVEQPRWENDCAKVVDALKARPSHWWDYDQLARYTDIRPGSVRTRCSDVIADPARWGVELEKRFQPGSRGCVEIRIKA